MSQKLAGRELPKKFHDPLTLPDPGIQSENSRTGIECERESERLGDQGTADGYRNSILGEGVMEVVRREERSAEGSQPPEDVPETLSGGLRTLGKSSAFRFKGVWV